MVSTLLQRSQSFPARKRQTGAETVEVMFTLTIFLLLTFTIIHFAILLYDQGVITHAARVGARQSSLYWVYPDRDHYDREDPKKNIRIDERMIESAVVATLEQLVAASDIDDIERVYTIVRGEAETDHGAIETGDRIPVRGLSGDSICADQPCYRNQGGIRIQIHDNQYLGLTGIDWIPDEMKLGAEIKARPEADF